MMRSMFAAISGLKVHQTMLDVTANDIANVNTIGYKAGRTTFKDQLSQLQRAGAGPAASLGGANAVQVGLGVQLGSVDNLMGGGALQSTGNPLDVAIQGPGWFRVAPADAPPTAPTGNFQYTRAGNFTLNRDGYLITQDGMYVMGMDTPGNAGTPQLIQLAPGATNVAIGQDGSVQFDDPATLSRATAGFIQIAKFSNEAGLERVSSNRWQESPASGTAAVGTPGTDGAGLTVAGTVEMSNVDLASEFTTMITAQRGFQANSRVISTSDEMLQDLVNLKR
jgi:flagellar hook protein FlgE